MIHCCRIEPAGVADAQTEPAVVVAVGRIEPAGVAIQFGDAHAVASEVALEDCVAAASASAVAP